MGKSLIIKGADFSESAVPVLPEGYMNLTEENALYGEDFYFNVPAHKIGRDTSGEHPCMLYWKIAEGSIIKIKPKSDFGSIFAFFTQYVNVGDDYSQYLVQGFDDVISLEANTDIQTYTLNSECWLQLYQYNDKSYFPSVLIYKP